jgi:hypothetical protein
MVFGWFLPPLSPPLFVWRVASVERKARPIYIILSRLNARETRMSYILGSPTWLRGFLPASQQVLFNRRPKVDQSSQAIRYAANPDMV